MFIYQNNAAISLELRNVTTDALDLMHIDSPYVPQCSVYKRSNVLNIAFTYNG